MADKKSEKKNPGSKAERDWCLTLWEKDLRMTPGEFIIWFSGLAQASKFAGLYQDEGGNPSAYINEIRFGVMQREMSKDIQKPRSQRAHWQIFIQFTDRIGMKRLKDLFNNDTLHCEVRRGTPNEAKEYCEKADSRATPVLELEDGLDEDMEPDPGPYSIGVWNPNGAGGRSDLYHFAGLIGDGKSNRELAKSCPGTYMRYSKNAETLRNALFDTPDREGIQTIVFWGAPGAGKSTAARSLATRLSWELGDKGRYFFKHSTGLWWDGYDQQKVGS